MGKTGVPTTRADEEDAPLLGRGGSTVAGKKTVRLSVLPMAGLRVPHRLQSGHTLGNDSLSPGDNQDEKYDPRKPNRHMESFSIINDPDVRAVDRVQSFAPKRLLDIENGTSIVVSQQCFLDPNRFQEVDESGALVVTAAKTTAPAAQEDALFFAERAVSLRERLHEGSVRDFDISNEVGIFGGAWRGCLRRLLSHTYDPVSAHRITRQLQLFLPFLSAHESYLVGQVIEAMDLESKRDVAYILKIAFANRNVSRILVQTTQSRWDFLWHWHSQITWNRWFDGWGQLPIVGITSFPATENFPATRDHALASITRLLLGPGNWITRVLTQGREGLLTDNPSTVAQNLAPESNGFELANRNQYGTYFGRLKTNEFRFHHRLPTDESIVRTFVAQPLPTMVNNGVVHTLRQVARHWHAMLNQPSGNFAHQRMEQLDPIETMRFHIPVVCLVLSSLRGRNQWDSFVLGPFVRHCQELQPSRTIDGCKALVREMQDRIVPNLCAGIASVIDPLRSWLHAILLSCDMLEQEAQQVYEAVTAVEIGIRLGHDLMTQVTWKIPSDKDLKKGIMNHLKGKNPGANVSERRIRSALLLTTPRDKRTLIELVKNKLDKTRPCQLLLGRVKTLLQRDLRRELLNEAIRELSQGDYVEEVVHDEWYWLEEGEKRAAYVYDAKVTGRDLHRFVHVDSGLERFVRLHNGSVRCRAYVPVAEAVTRAQRAYMNIELDHGKKFKYNAFMEFTYLRIALRRLMILSQLCCEELDNARLNVLREVQRSNQVQVALQDLEPGRQYFTYDSQTKEYQPFMCQRKFTPVDPEWVALARTKIVKVPPQSIIVIGGGPTGLMTTIHCTENVLVSGGEMKLYEARDAFTKGGSTFERAQIVRLDARWIAMLRYHLGTGFEDVFIPASGETDAQLGNTLPTQGFVEITIKDLENMLHVEISKLWSKGVIQCYTNSKTRYDLSTNNLIKLGEALKIDDRILRRFDPNGNPSKEYWSWKVANLIYTQPLGLDDLKIGVEYGVYIRMENAVLPFKLTGVDLISRTYSFKALRKGVADLKATAHNLPSVYPRGTARHADVSTVILECVQKGPSGGYARDELPMKSIRKEKFSLDIGHTHVIECIGKPHGSRVHFSATTQEPYGVCCIQGLKISLGMHNFGEKRWGQGLLDDFRSTNDQNTRIVGDFTKMVRQPLICKRMYKFMRDDKNWQTHFTQLVDDTRFQDLNEFDPVVPKLVKATKMLADYAPTFQRQTLQTRFFETGDNYYLGMEFCREYDRWKDETAEELVAALRLKFRQDDSKKKGIDKLKSTFAHHIDRLWYDACLETIRHGDVYNPGARRRVPRIHTINSYEEQKLLSLPVGESFRLVKKPQEKYEVVIKERKRILVRNVEGMISKMERKTKVLREGNLTRNPDGNQESKVALATFPVGHYVNHRTMRLNNESRGYVFAFVGDEQATPHFMRYSGLTGACINAMLFNNFIKTAIDGSSFEDRFRTYSKETNWSNGEVVTRGTGSNFGRDGFLRPGFSYEHGIDFLHSKVVEYMETKQDLNNILDDDWKAKFAAALIPKGLEFNEMFRHSFYEITQTTIFDKILKEAKMDKTIPNKGLEAALMQRKQEMVHKRQELGADMYWSEFIADIDGLDDRVKVRMMEFHCEVAKRLEQTVDQIVSFATKGALYDDRLPSQVHSQPKPVDSIVDDFAVQAQNFANSLTMSSAFSAGAVAFNLVDILGNGSGVAGIFSGIIGGLNILLSFGTMANVSQYKIRNEEARTLFYDEKFLGVKKAAFCLMGRAERQGVPERLNPFLECIDTSVQEFVNATRYYDVESPKSFLEVYNEFKQNRNDPTALNEFQRLLTTYFIPEVYHVNSYIQERLVEVHRNCDEMQRMLWSTTKKEVSTDRVEAAHLFYRLNRFTSILENSLQRGPTRFGFLKQRKLWHWDCSVAIRYFYNMCCCASADGPMPLSPIQTEALGITLQAREISDSCGGLILRREVQDLQQLYFATRESEVASLVFMSGFFVFVASWIFSIARIIGRAGGPTQVEEAGAWALLASSTGAILAIFHLVRKMAILTRLWFVLGQKVLEAPTALAKENISQVRTVTMTQMLLTLLRTLAAGSAAVSLPWALAVMAYDDKIDSAVELPFYVALGSVCMALLATIAFFAVEYVVRYRLPPKLGEFVCEAFRLEIEELHRALRIPLNDIDSKQMQERQTWEYVARDFLHTYRFDTVFAADRFGSILQYIQSGMDERD